MVVEVIWSPKIRRADRGEWRTYRARMSWLTLLDFSLNYGDERDDATERVVVAVESQRTHLLFLDVWWWWRYPSDNSLEY